MAAAAKPKEEVKESVAKKPVVANHSFMANIFRGEVEGSQVFPYPYNLTEEQVETVAMVVDPVTRFFAVSKFTAEMSSKYCFIFLFKYFLGYQ